MSVRTVAVALLIGVGGLFLIVVFLGLEPPERPMEAANLGSLADPDETYDPFKAGETLPPGYRQVLPRDVILPVYDPEFLQPGEVSWSEETLVIGVALAGEAKAYPVSHLNAREMVIDRMGNIPILVTW